MEHVDLLDEDWRKKWKKKEITPEEAIQKIAPGNRVFIHTGCSEPQALTNELIKQAEALYDIEIIHFLTIWPKKYFKRNSSVNLFRHNTFFIGETLRESINMGEADYTPVHASEIPNLFISGRRFIDVALIQVSPPDRYGFCSFGINVDFAKPIAQFAYLTIAEINPQMPRTLGNSFIHIKEIDFYVYNNTPLFEYFFKGEESPDVIERIGQNVAYLVPNKSTIHIGFGNLPNACLKYLEGKKDLGMHSHFITDNIIPLIEKSVLTCRKKNFHPEKIITSFCLGSKKLYDFIDNNPYIEFYPSDYVCKAKYISMNKNMVSIVQGLQVDLTGQVNSASKGYNFYTGIGDTVDFIRGAALSKGGRPIIVLPSTMNNGKESSIVSHLDEGTGVVLTRADVHYVITEWGIAYLHGRAIRDRVMELICIAHPKFRQQLLEEAKELNYIYKDQMLSCDVKGNICIYPKHYETVFKTKNNVKVIIRPVKTTDESLLRELYYSLDEKDRYLRFFEVKKEFRHSKTQKEVNIDYENIFSLGAFVGEISDPEMIGNASYHYNPNNNMAEFDFIMKQEWRGMGIGSYLYHYLIMIAKEKGIRGFYGNIHVQNRRTVNIIKKGGYTKITPPKFGEKELFYQVFFE
ncbi:MAG: GNAT family N-acetyltransferase, partial [Promethearchaeota archaeon]